MCMGGRSPSRRAIGRSRYPLKNGGRSGPMSDRTLDDQLAKYLADAHSIEEQALIQLRLAPRIAGDDRLAAVFRQHLEETERQKRLVDERLGAHGGDPSRIKDLVMKAGGAASPCSPPPSPTRPAS